MAPLFVSATDSANQFQFIWLPKNLSTDKNELYSLAGFTLQYLGFNEVCYAIFRTQISKFSL